MDDVVVLTELNDRFIEAFRHGSWAMLEPILAPTFAYLNGRTGAVQQLPDYIGDLEGHPLPSLTIDEVAVHVDGDTAFVSARTTGGNAKYSRYIDTYARTENGWACVHACVWPLG